LLFNASIYFTAHWYWL
jgi:hypothetical protein